MVVAGVIGKLSVRAVFLLFLPLLWTDDLLQPSSHCRGLDAPEADRRVKGAGQETAEALSNSGHMQNVECCAAGAWSRLEAMPIQALI